MKRRVLYLVFAVITIVLGLLSRKLSFLLPEIINLTLGDALYAVMIYWGVRFLLPHLSRMNTLFLAISICYTIELSQLYQVSWLNEWRSTTIGSLMLGRGFLWSDLVAYTFGCGMGYLLDPRWPGE